MTDNSVSRGNASPYMIGNNGYPANPYTSPSLMEEAHSKSYFFCYQCEITFDDSKHLETHNADSHGQRKKCAQCPATFRRQDHLKRHIQSLHTNNKYCKCPVCEKDCTRQDILAKHIKSKHSTNPEVFKCRDCSQFQCNNLTDLEKHEQSHLTVDRHVCQHCQTTFKRRDHMLRHIKSQHLNQSVVCPLCGQSYKRTDHVARHVREKHKMGLLNGKLVKSDDLIGPD